MDTVEEVIAIAMTNLYASERKRPVRNDHHGFRPIANSKQWVENMRPPLQEFCRQEQWLAYQLEKVSPFGFNPLRDCKAPLGWVQL